MIFNDTKRFKNIVVCQITNKIRPFLPNLVYLHLLIIHKTFIIQITTNLLLLLYNY